MYRNNWAKQIFVCLENYLLKLNLNLSKDGYLINSDLFQNFKFDVYFLNTYFG